MDCEHPMRICTAVRIAVALSLCLLLVVTLSGCGGTTKSATPTPTPTPGPTPSPGPMPSPTPSPSTPDSYMAVMFNDIPKVPAPVGQITIDSSTNDGTGNLQVNGTFANRTIVLQFCPYPQELQNCSNVTSFMTDAQGAANVNFKFPQKGTFSGMFQLACGGEQCFVSGTGSMGVNFKSAELPASSITGGINQTTGTAPGSGAIVVNGTMAHLTLTGTTPNHQFGVALCSMFLSTACQTLASVTTDAQGNASADVGNVQPAGWNVFTVSDSAGVEFVTAFRVQ